MVKQQHTFEDLGVKVETSCFKTALGKKEVHAMFHVQPNGDLFEGQQKRPRNGSESTWGLIGQDTGPV